MGPLTMITLSVELKTHEAVKPSGLPTDFVKISVKEAMHMCFSIWDPFY